MSDLKSRPLFQMRIDLHPIKELGTTPAGVRRVVPVAGGQFCGQRLQGTVSPHAGSDFLLTRSDGSFQQDVRLVLETDDGAVILMTYRGIRHSAPDVAERIARGEEIAPSEYYLRTAPFFETGSPKYRWLNMIVSIGLGERRLGGALYDVHEII
jgi:hypothetical protein